MRDPEPALLAVLGARVRYGPVEVLHGVDLELRRGEVVGLVGPNGAGKTTLLSALMGVVPLHDGDVQLAGRSLRGCAPEAIARRGVALVPEGRQIFGRLTVDENLRLGLTARRPGPGLADDLAWVAELFPVVREFAGRPAGVLSGGQQQQLAIARALVARPDVLLLDEPSLGLAPAIVDRVFEAIAAIRERGVSILLVEQRARRTVAFADRTHVLGHGLVQLTLSPSDAADVERITAAYFGS